MRSGWHLHWSSPFRNFNCEECARATDAAPWLSPLCNSISVFSEKSSGLVRPGSAGEGLQLGESEGEPGRELPLRPGSSSRSPVSVQAQGTQK